MSTLLLGVPMLLVPKSYIGYLRYSPQCVALILLMLYELVTSELARKHIRRISKVVLVLLCSYLCIAWILYYMLSIDISRAYVEGTLLKEPEKSQYDKLFTPKEVRKIYPNISKNVREGYFMEVQNNDSRFARYLGYPLAGLKTFMVIPSWCYTSFKLNWSDNYRAR